MKYAISFDIVDDHIRVRTVKTLLQYGYRVQKSVFEAYMSKEQVQECIDKLEKIIDNEVDSVRFYPLCKDCESKLLIKGIGKKIEEVKYRII
jgi:CRISPR-associated protein Cas2